MVGCVKQDQEVFQKYYRKKVIQIRLNIMKIREVVDWRIFTEQITHDKYRRPKKDHHHHQHH